jgi:hypothetical protein
MDIPLWPVTSLPSLVAMVLEDNAVAEFATAQQVSQRANALNRLGDLMGVGDCLGCLAAPTADGDEMG